ncbi:MAG: hypothetical protein R3E48_09800 [Burkholderiaceae bacterium]
MWSKPFGVRSKLNPKSAASAATSATSTLAKRQWASETPAWRAKPAMASGPSNGWLNPMVTTSKLSRPSASRALRTASARNRVATGHAWKQPV